MSGTVTPRRRPQLPSLPLELRAGDEEVFALFAIRARVVGAAAVTVLALLLAACGNAPDLTPVPNNSAGDVLAGPTSTAPPTPAPTTKKSAAPTSVRKAAGKARTATKPAKAAAPKAGADPGPAGWTKQGGDEFTGGALDSVWTAYDSVGGFGNGLRRPDAISLSGGLLQITANDEVSGGMSYGTGQTYGRWEFRARTDKGRGYGSAILLWPDSEQWPQDGELDMMEVPSANRSVAYSIVHYDDDGDTVFGGEQAGDFSQWHTFAFEWLPDRITWYVDGVKRFETTDKKMIPTKPMHMTIQLDQGPVTDWLDAPDDTTPAGLSLDVDWVRIYRR